MTHFVDGSDATRALAFAGNCAQFLPSTDLSVDVFNDLAVDAHADLAVTTAPSWRGVTASESVAATGVLP